MRAERKAGSLYKLELLVTSAIDAVRSGVVLLRRTSAATRDVCRYRDTRGRLPILEACVVIESRYQR